MKNFFPSIKNKETGKRTKIAVAISGGVDSSVVLAMLKEKGYDVFGVYFKTYKPDGDRTHCKKEGTDAKNICKFLDVPFYSADLQEEYKRDVFEYMIDSYKKGLTPNPDILCNKKIKFGHFFDFAFSKGAEYVATGHYAKHFHDFKKQKDYLVKAVDEDKDQTYFLSQIKNNSLKKTIFPLGEYEKKDVRKMAEKYGLFTAQKKDSQGICFIQKEVKIKDFLSQFIKTKKGDILDINGKKIGEHDGSIFFTIGQRHGFEIFPKFKKPNQGRIFVISKDLKKNTITVAEKKYLIDIQNKLEVNEIFIKDFNFCLSLDIIEEKIYYGRIRHRGELIKCKVFKNKENQKNKWQYKVVFEGYQKSIASGQFLAIYDDNICIGSGVII